MGTQGTGRKRSTNKERSTAEDDALNLIAREAEARLAAKRAARAEAREIRMKELERQQKELSDDDERMSVGSRGSVRVEDRDFDKGPRVASVGGTSSRRGSGETALTVDANGSIREIKEALAEVEEKYRKAMVSNAQLDNEKSNLMYQVDTLKDSLMELEELLSESRRQFDDKLKEFERQKHAHSVLQFQFDELKETLKQSEELLNEIRQLRLKQDGYIREISDLQETVEWKDKKIGALERQKEYSDAIRMERDELREEAVKLRDILKKHGIVLGPDLNINGDAGSSEVDGSAGAEPRPAQESQPAPAEGNGVLGSTEELRACREEDVAPEQQDETLEDVKESHDEQAPEAQTCFRSEESHLDGQITVDPIDRPDAKAKAVIIVSQDLQQIQTSGETETSEVDSISHSGLTEAQRTGTEAAGGHLSGGQESKQEVVTTEPLAKQAVPVGPNSEPQQEPEEAENDEAEETVSKSQAQVSTASGKKKKKKKKGKKKGGTHENKDQEKAGTEKQNEKTRKDSVVQNNGPTAEQDTRGSAAKPQDNQELEKVKHLESSENVSTKENLQEPNTDPGSKGHNQEKTTNTKMLEGADVLGSSQVPRLGVETVDDMQSEECDDPEKPNQGSAVEALNESEITGPDQEGNLVTCKSKDDPDSSGDASSLQRSATDHVSGDAGKTENTEMLEQSETVGSSETCCHIGTRAELPEGEQIKETSPTTGETADPPEGFLQDEPLEESVPESNMVEGDARETNLPSNEGNEGPNKHLPSCDDSATTPAFQEPNNDHVSGDQEEETLTSEMLEEANAVESPETPDEEIVEVLQNQEETSEPEKHESVLQTTETSQAETIKGPNEPKTAEDVKEMESETGSDRVANLLTSGKSEDPEEAFLPDSSSPDDVAVVQNVHTESESVDGDEKMIKSIVELAGEEHNGVPESGTGSEINEETSASSANDDTREQPETSSTSNSPKASMREPEEAAEPDDGQPSETSEEICRLDEELNRARGQPENPPLHMNDEVKLANLTKAETGDTDSPPKEEQTEESTECPEPELCPNTKEVNSSQRPLAEQVKDSMEEPDGNDSPPHVQLDRVEDDGEEDEGQSFDFDDSDVEAAVESGLSNKLEQEDVEEGAEVNGKSPELCQSNAETNTEDEEEKVSEDDDSQVDQSSTQNDLRCGDNTPEKVENVPENIEQKTSSTVEEGLDATEVPPEQTDGAKEVLQAGKDPKKKKGKGKSKEDCKMS